MKARVPLSPLLALAWTGLAASLLQVLLGLSLLVRPAARGDIVHLGLVEVLVFVLAVLGVVAVHGGQGSLRHGLGLRPTAPLLLVLGALLGLVAHLPAASIDALFQRLVPTPEDELAGRIALLTAESPLRLVLVLLAVACAGPLVEELFFRGALYGALRRTRSLWGAAATTSVCFVFGHLDPYMWPALTVVSVLMGFLRAASGSLLPSLTMHVVFNATTTLSLALGEPPSRDPPAIEPWPTALGWGLTLLLGVAVQYVAARAPRARRGRAEDAE